MSQPQSESVQNVFVFDVGGSHVSAAVCARGTYQLRGLSHAPLPQQEPGAESRHFSAASFCRLIHTLGLAAAKAAQISPDQVGGACLAMPGPFDYERGVSQMKHKLESLFQFDLKSALAARFGWQPDSIRFVNDAAAFLLGEVGAGAARGYNRSIGITLGTGIGCAFAIGNRIAPNGPGNSEGVPVGGEMWNLPFQGSIVEDFVSTRFLRKRYQELTGMEAEVSEVAAIAACVDNAPCAELDAVVSHQASAAKSALKAAKAASAARESFQEFGHNLALALNQHATAFRPDVIVLGGGIARAANLFLPSTRKALAGINAKILIAALMDGAPLAGAGVRWFTAE